MPKQEVQGPTKDRYLKSYEMRRAYKDAIQCARRARTIVGEY